MKMLLLTYPRLDISVQAIITPAKTEAKIKKEWKQKYGKLLERCIIKVFNDEAMTIRHIPSGKEYKNKARAAAANNCSEWKVMQHLEKKLQQTLREVEYEFEYI